MSDHLPECEWAKDDGQCRSYEGWDERVYDSHRDRADRGVCSRCGVVCICPQLRACEERVLREAPVSVFAKAFHDGQAVGVDKGLDAARDAVADVPSIDQRVDENGLIRLVYDKGEVLDAIDALRGER